MASRINHKKMTEARKGIIEVLKPLNFLEQLTVLSDLLHLQISGMEITTKELKDIIEKEE